MDLRFADEYVRTRHLLVYSACNKLYRKEILDKNRIRFREGMSFGEDRLFNHGYLRYCRSVITSSVRMFRDGNKKDRPHCFIGHVGYL
ncbi:MAG: hypothetical protein Q4D71_13095 [Oscillospiraceae bacterium]|nr:hypothetical protein [Oscillospiraceae bacterium]